MADDMSELYRLVEIVLKPELDSKPLHEALLRRERWWPK
jgi:hypothetical protein